MKYFDIIGPCNFSNKLRRIIMISLIYIHIKLIYLYIYIYIYKVKNNSKPSDYVTLSWTLPTWRSMRANQVWSKYMRTVDSETTTTAGMSHSLWILHCIMGCRSKVNRHKIETNKKYNHKLEEKEKQRADKKSVTPHHSQSC